MQNYQYTSQAQPQYYPMQNPSQNYQMQNSVPIQNQFQSPQIYTSQQNFGLTQPQYSSSREGETPLMANPNNLSIEAIECLDDLKGCSEAIVTKYFEGLIFRDALYEVEVKYSSGDKRYILLGKRELGSFFDAGSVKVHLKYIPRGSELSEMKKDDKFERRLIDVFCTKQNKNRYTVINAENKSLFGNIELKHSCCCSDPDIHITNSKNFLEYRVDTDGSQCGYCCCCEGCCSSAVDYSILNQNHNQVLGNIIKNEFSGSHNEMLAYKIIFPNDATPEEKVLLISTSMAIDNIIYPTLGNKNIENKNNFYFIK